MNLILEKTDQVPWFTNLREVLDAASLAPEDYDWYVSDIEVSWTPPGFVAVDQWMTGAGLASFLHQHDVQFIWAVFSAVPKGFRASPSSPPYVDGNPHYWSGAELRPQFDSALFEIACWDSSGVILVGLPEEAARAFLRRYTDARPVASSVGAARTNR